MRKTLIAFAATIACIPMVVLGLNAAVVLGGSGATHDVAEAPHRQAALVLGAQVRPDGSLSSMLADRVEVAAELYRDGKVDKVLVSGDHGRIAYDEVNPMRRALMAKGVPERDIFMDHAGFDTWDSVQRARKVFGVESALVVTQGFHMPRSLWLARRAGLKADGVVADRQDYGPTRRILQGREFFARVKAFGDVVTGADPRFLGPRIPIAGDGRATRG